MYANCRCTDAEDLRGRVKGVVRFKVVADVIVSRTGLHKVGTPELTSLWRINVGTRYCDIATICRR